MNSVDPEKPADLDLNSFQTMVSIFEKKYFHSVYKRVNRVWAYNWFFLLFANNFLKIVESFSLGSWKWGQYLTHFIWD